MTERRLAGFGSGFSLIEVLIAMGLLTAMAIGLAQVFAMSARATMTARTLTSTTAMAGQKMEQLRALTWSFAVDGSNLPVSDRTSNLSVTPAAATGRGLAPSPANALTENVPGFCDFLDASGSWVGTGTVAPSAAVYVRRWAIVPLPADPANTLVLQVLATPVVDDRMRATTTGRVRRMPGDALLTSVKTRKAP
jgi:type II secretory pathway pseudopilin PulG